MKTIELSWTEVVNRYDDDQVAFEQYVCEELDIELTDWDALNEKFDGKIFVVRPNYDYIEWRGVINSDFRLSLKVGE